MVAKMESVFEALDGEVPRVHVIQWQGPETLRQHRHARENPRNQHPQLDRRSRNPVWSQATCMK